MKPRALLLAAASIALLSSAAPYRAAPALGYRLHERLTVYEAACLGTETPPELLRAIARVESGECDKAVGDGGESIGRFQIREVFRAERVAKFGEYDPRSAREAGHVAARILEEAFRTLGDWELAAAAYRQGVRGVREDGATGWYLERVRRAR